MAIESSYENISPDLLKELASDLIDRLRDELKTVHTCPVCGDRDECNQIHVRTGARYRRVPVAAVLDTHRNQMGECSAKTGHVLRFDENGHVYCTSCPAEWKDEGF
jgi:hypothetical protein